MTDDGGKLNLRKNNGLIKDVFRTRHMRGLTGQMGIGHVRYPTAGSSSPALAQPFYVNSPYGLALAHNGNLTNSFELSRDLFKEDLRHINTDSDSEVLLNVLAHELQQQEKITPTPEDIFQALSRVFERCRGGFAALVMITGYGILGFRDRNGIRPLVFGSRETDRGREYMIASESVALDSQGFSVERDVAPGEGYILIKIIGCILNNALKKRAIPHVYLSMFISPALTL
jgi:amidophosphoribosyltransferase